MCMWKCEFHANQCTGMDNFDVQEELGRGTYGIVRKCVDKQSQKVLAIKEINAELAAQNDHKISSEIKVSCASFIAFDSITTIWGAAAITSRSGTAKPVFRQDCG